MWLWQMMFQKCVEGDYGWMPEELVEEGKNTNEDQVLIEEGEPDEEEYIPPPMAEEQSQWVHTSTRSGRVSK
jgi:hypothetical protein